jgi:hypothetical protein
MNIRVIKPEETFEKLMKDRENLIFYRYLRDYSKDKQLRKLYYNFMHTRYSNKDEYESNRDLIILLNFLKTHLEIDFSDSKSTKKAEAFMKKYEKLLDSRAKLTTKDLQIMRKIDDIDYMKDAYYPFYGAIQSMRIAFKQKEKEKKYKKELRKRFRDNK